MIALGSNSGNSSSTGASFGVAPIPSGFCFVFKSLGMSAVISNSGNSSTVGATFGVAPIPSGFCFVFKSLGMSAVISNSGNSSTVGATFGVAEMTRLPSVYTFSILSIEKISDLYLWSACACVNRALASAKSCSATVMRCSTFVLSASACVKLARNCGNCAWTRIASSRLLVAASISL